MGHISDQNLLKLSKGDMIERLNINNAEDKEICSICAQSKITRQSFKKVSEEKSKRPLELVHSDICGPIIPTSTYDSKNYFLTFLDDYPYTYVCPLYI